MAMSRIHREEKTQMGSLTSMAKNLSLDNGKKRQFVEHPEVADAHEAVAHVQKKLESNAFHQVLKSEGHNLPSPDNLHHYFLTSNKEGEPHHIFCLNKEKNTITSAPAEKTCLCDIDPKEHIVVLDPKITTEALLGHQDHYNECHDILAKAHRTFAKHSAGISGSRAAQIRTGNQLGYESGLLSNGHGEAFDHHEEAYDHHHHEEEAYDHREAEELEKKRRASQNLGKLREVVSSSHSSRGTSSGYRPSSSGFGRNDAFDEEHAAEADFSRKQKVSSGNFAKLREAASGSHAQQSRRALPRESSSSRGVERKTSAMAAFLENHKTDHR